MKFSNIVTQALAYHDNSKHKYKKFYKSDYKFDFVRSTNNIDVPICYFLKDNKIIAKGNNNILGIYLKNENLWVWGWSIMLYDINNSFKNRTYVSRKILNYGLDITFDKYTQSILKSENQSDTISAEDEIAEKQRNIVFHIELKQDLLTSKIKITHPIQLEKILAVSQYITKSDLIYPENVAGVLYFHSINFIND